MALIGAYSQQPGEQLPVDISYTAVIGGRTVSLMTATVVTPVGMTLVSQEVVGEVLQLFITGGTTGTSYRWSVLMSITIGGRLTKVEDEFDIVVQEV